MISRILLLAVALTVSACDRSQYPSSLADARAGGVMRSTSSTDAIEEYRGKTLIINWFRGKSTYSHMYVFKEANRIGYTYFNRGGIADFHFKGDAICFSAPFGDLTDKCAVFVLPSKGQGHKLFVHAPDAEALNVAGPKSDHTFIGEVFRVKNGVQFEAGTFQSDEPYKALTARIKRLEAEK